MKLLICLALLSGLVVSELSSGRRNIRDHLNEFDRRVWIECAAVVRCFDLEIECDDKTKKTLVDRLNDYGSNKIKNYILDIFGRNEESAKFVYDALSTANDKLNKSVAFLESTDHYLRSNFVKALRELEREDLEKCALKLHYHDIGIENFDVVKSPLLEKIKSINSEKIIKGIYEYTNNDNKRFDYVVENC